MNALNCVINEHKFSRCLDDSPNLIQLPIEVEYGVKKKKLSFGLCNFGHDNVTYLPIS